VGKGGGKERWDMGRKIRETKNPGGKNQLSAKTKRKHKTSIRGEIEKTPNLNSGFRFWPKIHDVY